MTVPTTTNLWTYTGDGAHTVYPYTTRVLSSADLTLTVEDTAGTLTTLVLNTDYTVTGVLSYTGGTVVLASNLANGSTLAIFRDPVETQLVALQDQGAYRAPIVEQMVDLVTMIVQALRSKLSRAISFPVTETGGDNVLPALVNRANQIAGWDADGNFAPISAAVPYGTGNFTVDHFDAGSDFTPGSTTTLTLSQDPGTVDNLDVVFDAGAQLKSSYSVAGLVVTFDAPIPLGVLAVECKQGAVLPLATLGNNTVGTAALQSSAVTTAKLADAAVTTPKLADASVTLAKLAADALQGGKNAIVNGNAAVANGTDYVASVSGTYGYGKSELCKGAITGTAVAGTLTRVTNSSVGRTGLAFRWSAMTTTGAGICKFRFFIESKDAVNYKNQTCSLSALVRHDTGASVNFAIVVSKANAADDFSAVTLISTGPTIAVASATNGQLYNRAVAMGDCTNGIMVEITAAIGAVTGKLVDLTQVQFELGSVETDYSFEPLTVTLAKVKRLFQVLFSDSGQSYVGIGAASTDILLEVTMQMPVEMRADPAVVVSSAAGVWHAMPGDIALTYSAALPTSRTVGLAFAGAAMTPQAAYAVRLKNAQTGLITADARF